MTDALLRKLGSFCPFNPKDAALLAGITVDHHTVGAHEDIIREGEVPRDVHLITSGFAIRYKNLADGTRQIFAYLLPGDFCDLHVFILDKMDHGIATLSPCSVVDIPRDTILRLTERPAIARALWWATLVDESTLREALVNIGRRRAEERVGHFLCELLVRLEVVGLVSDNRFELPLTQAELADTMGLSTVHINRVLQFLRGQKFITFDRKSLAVLDVDGLKRFSGFDPNYLHLAPYRTKPVMTPS
ncbi:Crp/Fnr family transcriptional regulator [Lichenibacterium minor]|uniref:Crp/Fnr family transcriptional regulator n=1 Tax=Lichenibacterium minor TaxID=2316528 RepID=A0A4Q2TY10_9HYPH|nr:Crp/Fnr family transcriptional regulator [Lichenibacterium minor]RYC28963.1 Crp/Fnr family transcriptional regulator [Lichenibacterium minor]